MKKLFLILSLISLNLMAINLPPIITKAIDVANINANVTNSNNYIGGDINVSTATIDTLETLASNSNDVRGNFATFGSVNISNSLSLPNLNANVVNANYFTGEDIKASTGIITNLNSQNIYSNLINSNYFRGVQSNIGNLQCSGNSISATNINGNVDIDSILRPNQGIFGISNGSNSNAGLVTEYKASSIGNAIGITTAGVTLSAQDLELTPGRWLVYYSVFVTVTTDTSLNSTSSVSIYLSDNTNTQIGQVSRLGALTPANAAITNSLTLTGQQYLSLSSTNFYRIRGLLINTSGTGSASELGSGNSLAYFYAIRLF
jgi:hypothetical protein